MIAMPKQSARVENCDARRGTCKRARGVAGIACRREAAKAAAEAAAGAAAAAEAVEEAGKATEAAAA